MTIVLAARKLCLLKNKVAFSCEISIVVIVSTNNSYTQKNTLQNKWRLI